MRVRTALVSLGLLACGTGLSACAGRAQTESAPPAEHPATVVVLPPAPPAPPPQPGPDLSPEARARADAAAITFANQLFAVEVACRDGWVEKGPCEAPELADSAAAYQAYYAFRNDPASSEGRIDALPRLGGRDVSPEVLASRITFVCEERCRVARTGSIGRAVTEAAAACAQKRSGHADCDAVTKKMASTVREDDVARWSASCEGACDDSRRTTWAEEARRNRKRLTGPQAAACRAECERKYGGGWCGTSIMACLGDCY